MTGPFRSIESARRTGALAVLCLALVGAACRSAGSDIPLAHTADSPPALAREVLDALARGDRARLEELALTEDEFRTVVWPRLPSSRPEVGLPVDYAWSDLHQKSVGDMLTTLESLRGRRLELVDVAFRGETTDYEEFRVHRKSVLQVRAESGEVKQVRLFGSMIEYAGQVKVFSYVVD
jgi:hypothetical protein